MVCRKLSVPKPILDNMNTFFFDADSRKYKSWENEHKTRKKLVVRGMENWKV